MLNDDEGTVASGIPNAAQIEPEATPSRLARAFRVEWLGQTVASLCWIASVLMVGASSIGDWLQLLAASAWLLANIAALVAVESN